MPLSVQYWTDNPDEFDSVLACSDEHADLLEEDRVAEGYTTEAVRIDPVDEECALPSCDIRLLND